MRIRTTDKYHLQLQYLCKVVSVKGESIHDLRMLLLTKTLLPPFERGSTLKGKNLLF